MATASKAAEQSPISTTRVRIFRVAEGQAAVVRMLSPQCLGINTHWIRGRGVYCPGDKLCNPANHRMPTFWKGYVGAHHFDQAAGKWFPIALEVTESLELDFRHVYQAGQCWEVFRLPRQGKKIFPVEGKLLHDTYELPHAKPFNVAQVVATVYNAPNVKIDVKNPTPERLVCEILESVAPLFKMPLDEPKAPTPEEIERLKEQRKRLKGMIGGR